MPEFLGLFTTTCPIMENDTYKSISLRLARNERNVKDSKKVKLFRYEDPILGPRKLPSIDTINDGKIEILGDEFVFKLDLVVTASLLTFHNRSSHQVSLRVFSAVKRVL